MTYWSPLQTSICIAIATAKIAEFENQSYRVGGLIRLGLVRPVEAGDLLHEAAIYNSLPFEYGQDFIQTLMAEGIKGGGE